VILLSVANGSPRALTLVVDVVGEFRTCADGPLEIGIQLGPETLVRGEARAGATRFSADVEANARADGTVLWRGSAIHGPARARFLYISARHPDGPATLWEYRIKVPLSTIGLELAGLTGGDTSNVERVVLEAQCRARDGGTGPLINDGWKRVSA
jgi:hypothetical protein